MIGLPAIAVKRRTMLAAAGRVLVAAAAPYVLIHPAQSQVVAERPKHPKAAVRTLLVPENYATLQLAYAACKPGDHISLADGTYAGNFIFDRDLGPKPVVIRSRSLNGAAFSGQLTVSGTGHRFHEIKTTFQGNDTTASSAAINVVGSYFWLTRSWISSRHGIWTGKKANYIFIGWNRFTGKSNIGTACSHIYMDAPAGTHWSTIDKGPHHIYVYRNFFYDTSSTRGNEDHCIYLGQTNAAVTDIGQVPECYIEYNLIYNDGVGRSRERGIYLKRGAIMRYNDINLPQGTGSNGFRHSRGGKIYGNTIRGDDLSINGGIASEFAQVYGNAIDGMIRLWAGSYSVKVLTGALITPHQAADYCLLAGNRSLGAGPLTVSIGVHADNLDTLREAGGGIDHVTIYTGGFPHTLELAGAPWCDNATITNPPLPGWGPIGPVTPITLQPYQVGQELADQR